MSTWSEVLEDAMRTSKLIHPERWVPNGEQLRNYPELCFHSRAEKQSGVCGDGWQHRLIAWDLAHPRDVAEQATTTERPPDPDEPAGLEDQDAPYGRVRGEA